MSTQQRRIIDLDKAIGSRLQEIRVSRGLTQQQLAEMMGVTYQQAHKYERGVNRISAGRLQLLADKLGLPINAFYEGLSQNSGEAGIGDNHIRYIDLETARALGNIRNEKLHQNLCLLISTISQAPVYSPAE